MRPLTALLIVTLLCSVAFAQDKPDDVSTRTYDIRHLITPVRDYPMRPMLHGSADNLRGESDLPGGGLFGGPKIIEMPRGEKPDPTPADEIVALLTQTVAPQSWRESGGAVGAIAQLKGVLVITQTAANHQAIAALLAQLNDAVRKPLRVQAHWLVLTPEQLATIKHPAGQESLAVVPDETLKAAKVYSRGQVTCFASQVNHIASTVERNYLTDIDPVIGTGVGAFDPTIDRISSGIGLQFRAMMVGDDTVTLDLCNELQESPDAPAEIKLTQPHDLAFPATRPMSGTTTLDRPRVVYQTTQTTLRLPLATPVLIGGVTLEPGAKDAPPREVYLVIRIDADKKQ